MAQVQLKITLSIGESCCKHCEMEQQTVELPITLDTETGQISVDRKAFTEGVKQLEWTRLGVLIQFQEGCETLDW
jgi:hypothetical protein